MGGGLQVPVENIGCGTLKSSGSQVWLIPAHVWGCAYVQWTLKFADLGDLALG